MKIEKVIKNKRYTLSNEGLKVGDKVYPIAHGRCLDMGGWILHGFDFKDFPDDPHEIMNMKHDNYKPYEVRTDKGYSPAETYYKIIKVEQRETMENKIGTLGLNSSKWVEETKTYLSTT